MYLKLIKTNINQIISKMKQISNSLILLDLESESKEGADRSDNVTLDGSWSEKLDNKEKINETQNQIKNTDSNSLFGMASNDFVNNNNESSNSSRSSTITSYNWIRRSFEDLDIEVVQTEIMQKRKRKDSNHHQQKLTMERKHPLLSFSSSLNSEQFYNKDGRNSKAVPYGDKDASNCFECRRMLGQVIDDGNGIPRQTEMSSYPCECPVTEVSCCDNCCSSSTSNKDFDENEDALMVN